MAKCFDFLGRDCYNKRKVETLPVRFPETGFDFFHAEGVAMTIKDIAKLSGVGVSTVSRVLNDRPDVSEESRRRVLEVIAEHNYLPNNSARSLVRTKSDTVGLVVRGVQNPFYTDIIRAIEHKLDLAGYTSEEMKMQNEGRKILHLPEMKVSCTCVRVPVVRSHSVSVVLRTKEKISVERARELIAAAPGCKLTDDLASKVYPMPLDTSDQDLVYVGRIRDDLTDERGLNLWCCGDQVRKGAATNTVQIAELLLEK